MSDDWSLKGQGLKDIDTKEETGFYTKEILETLHKKLIEDIHKFVPSMDILDTGIIMNEREKNKWQKGYQTAIVDCVDIINKRFGKE